MEALVESLKVAIPSTTTLQVPLLHSLIFSTNQGAVYPYQKLFSTALNDPILILYSSGSTGKLDVLSVQFVKRKHAFAKNILGDPKLVNITNGFFSSVDNARNVPLPHGREAQNLSLFDFGDDGGRFYCPFPPHHVCQSLR